MMLEEAPEKKKILVVYSRSAEASLPPGGYRFASRLKSFMYLTEEVRFLNALGGMRLCGLVIEEGVTKVTKDDFEYFLGRLWADPPSVMLMSKAQAFMLTEACQDLVRASVADGGQTREDLQTLRRKLFNLRLRITTHP